jgi:hypothetical protein
METTRLHSCFETGNETGKGEIDYGAENAITDKKTTGFFGNRSLQRDAGHLRR